MILGFKNRFVPKIINGTKIHTIREDSKMRWKEGRKINFAVNVRTKNYNQFALGTCTKVEPISIRHYDIIDIDKSTQLFRKMTETDLGICLKIRGVEKYIVININDRDLRRDEIIKLTGNDGFDYVHDFFEWFNKDFKGRLIYWNVCLWYKCN